MLSFLWLFSMRCLEEMGRFQRFFSGFDAADLYGFCKSGAGRIIFA